MDDILKTARSCRQYAMCKIDFLGTGLCPSGSERRYVAFYPQGRMLLYAALAEGSIPLTGKAVEVAESCDLCGICDFQCHFVTEMRPVRVMKALKEEVARRVASGEVAAKPPEDPLLKKIREIVGREWATNDPGITVTYSHDPSPLTETQMPARVVMPATREEVSRLLTLLDAEQVPWVVRANGTNVLGFHLGTGVVIDLNRMKEISFDEKNWCVKVGAGVAAFDLQREAVRRGYRVNVAEPAALVCGSTMCSGILSLFGAAYGTSGDNFVDADFVAPDGSLFSLNEASAPNLFAFRKEGAGSPGICTSVKAKLHPVTDGEEGLLVPFRSLAEAVPFAEECVRRRLGLAVGVLGAEYVSSFMAPTAELARTAREALEGRLGISCVVLVIGDAFARRSVAEMGRPVIDQRLFTVLSLGLPALKSAPWLDLLADLSGEEPFSYLNTPGFADLAETALAPSPAFLAREIGPDLRPSYEKLYARPEMTNLVWLNMFRITSTRVGRDKNFLPLLMYLPPDVELIAEMCSRLRDIALRHRLKNDFGFLTPVDFGKRCIFEYDYYADQNDADEGERLRQAAAEAGGVIEEIAARTGTVRWLKYIIYQGFSRKENILYA